MNPRFSLVLASVLILGVPALGQSSHAADQGTIENAALLVGDATENGAGQGLRVRRQRRAHHGEQRREGRSNEPYPPHQCLRYES